MLQHEPVQATNFYPQYSVLPHRPRRSLRPRPIIVWLDCHSFIQQPLLGERNDYRWQDTVSGTVLFNPIRVVPRPWVVYLDVPSKGSKLLPLLDDGMEEAEAKHHATPLDTQDCNTSTTGVKGYFDGLVQGGRYSIAIALELCLSCTNPSIYWHYHYIYWAKTTGRRDKKRLCLGIECILY